MRQEKEQASETIEELKKQHDLNMNETYAKHLTELKVKCNMLYFLAFILFTVIMLTAMIEL